MYRVPFVVCLACWLTYLQLSIVAEVTADYYTSSTATANETEISNTTEEITSTTVTTLQTTSETSSSAARESTTLPQMISSTATSEDSTGSTQTILVDSTTWSDSTNTPSPSPPCGFDAASFIGGIVLALGLCAIGYFIYKCFISKRAGVPYNQF